MANGRMRPIVESKNKIINLNEIFPQALNLCETSNENFYHDLQTSQKILDKNLGFDKINCLQI